MTSPSHDRSADTAPDVSVIVPTYNESGRIAELVETVCGVYRDRGIHGELVVVDDNSPDGTGRIADSLTGRYPLTVVHRAGKLGLGSAVMEGFEAARAPIVGVMDADFSHPPAVVPELLAHMRRTGADVVVGSRYIEGGAAENWPLARLLMSRVACVLALAAHAGARRDVRVLPDPPRDHPRRDDRGRRLQDPARAADAQPGADGRGSARTCSSIARPARAR